MTFPPDTRTIGETNLQEIVEIPMGGKKNIILDATILSTLMSCPRLADFRFNHNLISIGGKSNSLECGSTVHMFMEYYYRHIAGGMKREQAFGYGMSAAELYIKGCQGCSNFVATFCNDYAASPDKASHVRVCPICVPKPLCGHKVNEFPGIHNTPKDSEGYKTGWQWVLDTCEQYHIFYRNDHWVPLETEVVKGKVLYEDDEIRIMWKAKLDLVSDTNEGIYPVDHKTMKQNRDTNSMNNQFMGQCLIMGTYRTYINKVGFQTTLKPEEKFIRKPMAYSPARLLEWQSETLPFWAKQLVMYAEAGHYPPNFTNCEGKYGNCAFYKDVCSMDPDSREDEIKSHFMVGPVWNPTNDEDEV